MSRYSQLYIERGKPQSDSLRFRRRLAAYGADRFVPGYDFHNERQLLRSKLGVSVGYNGRISLEEFFLKSEMRDVLDAVTVLCQNVRGWDAPWLQHVGAVLSEEHMAYRIDQDGVVHPFVDAEFQSNQAAAVIALASPRFGEARDDFGAAFRHLRNGDGKSAIRSMFPAIEVAAKVLFPGALSRLMPNDLDRLLKPKIQSRYTGNEPAIDAAVQLLGGFKQWIIASQPYRHGQEVQEPVEPPQDFLVAHLSTGAAYLRWMIELAG